MNILVETRIAPKIVFDKENPILAAGELALEEELTGARIGDGKTAWRELDDLLVSKETIDKWCTIAKGVTGSHLVTLPNINFAYTTVNVDSNPLVEQVVDTIIKNKNYFSLRETKKNEALQTNASLYNTLTFEGSEIFDIMFLTSAEQEKIDKISRLEFKGKFQEQSRYYMIEDENAQNRIDDLKYSLLNLEHNVSKVYNEIFNEQEGILSRLESRLVPYNINNGNPGLVPIPTNPNRNLFLGAYGWVEVPLYGTQMKLSNQSGAKTIADAIIELQNKKVSITFADTANAGGSRPDKIYISGPSSASTSTAEKLYTNSNVYISGNVLMGAAYNDYAEARETKGIEAGRVVVENGDDTLSISTDRLMLGGNIVSDTYGMLIGETDKAKTPIALCGRVLAYPFENKKEYYPGAPVCTGPNGTVSLMSKDEVLHYPECIIGYVSAIPNYEEWNGKKVNDRIWIKVL